MNQQSVIKTTNLSSKSSIRINKENGKPLKEGFTVTGLIAPNSLKTFTFKIISATQQMKERNSAYNFFSID